MKQNSWTPMPIMRTPRGRFDVTQLNGAMYACGGSDGQKELDSAEVFDPAVGKWKWIDRLPSSRSSSGESLFYTEIFPWIHQNISYISSYIVTEYLEESNGIPYSSVKKFAWRCVGNLPFGHSPLGCRLWQQSIVVQRFTLSALFFLVTPCLIVRLSGGRWRAKDW